MCPRDEPTYSIFLKIQVWVGVWTSLLKVGEAQKYSVLQQYLLLWYIERFGIGYTNGRQSGAWRPIFGYFPGNRGPVFGNRKSDILNPVTGYSAVFENMSRTEEPFIGCFRSVVASPIPYPQITPLYLYTMVGW